MCPSYLETDKKEKLHKISARAWAMLESCVICPRRCGVNRLKGEKGFCQTGTKPKVCSFMAHHGEEPPISGTQGSGTIFFSYCNMSCAYCQNYQFSQKGEGREVSCQELANTMLELQKLGCHNLNFVTPTHVMPLILKSLEIAIKEGLHLPIVYNTSGYELAEIIKLLDGIIDIYLPDMRYADSKMAIKYSGAPDYPEYNQESVKEMHRQVGIARFNPNGIIEKGVIIRHLVLPDSISGTAKIMDFISREISPDTYISLMSQYYPCYRSLEFPEINRRLTQQEYKRAENLMHGCGLYNGWTQESFGLERFAGTNIKPVFKTDEEIKKQQ